MTDLELLRTIHPNHGERWDDKERRHVKKMFKKGETLESMSEQSGRSPNSLLAQLEGMSLVTQEGFSFFKNSTHFAEWGEFSSGIIK